MKNKMTVGFSLKGICIIIFITAIVTSLTTGLIIYNNSKIVLGSVSIKDDDALREFLKVYNSLDQNYYDDINKKEMVDAAISAMLDYLGEDYSTYMNKDETNNLASELSGKFKGIGISISKGREIAEVHEDTPASKAGFEVGDILVSVNGKSTEGLTQAQVANLIDKVNKNTIIVQRGEEVLTLEVTAENINTPLTNTIIETDFTNIGYIDIDAFTDTVGEEFAKALRSLESKGIDNLIIDLRNNSGGYLKGATDILNLFLKKDMVMYSFENKEGTESFRDDTEEHRDYPIVLLVNENSASASEVLTGALKDNLNATIVGMTTFGKGRVQQTKRLEDGSMVKFTSAKWLRPNGECIDNIGIDPDYEVDLIQDEDGNWIDAQFEKAVELLS